MYKLVALDLDGTLLNSSKEISERTINVLKNLKNKGIKIVLASARPYYRLVKYLEKLDIVDCQQYTITFNGALVVNNGTGKVLSSSKMSVEDIKLLLDIAKKHHNKFFLYTKDGVLANHYDEEYIKRNPDSIYKCVDFDEIDLNKLEIYKFAYVDVPFITEQTKGNIKSEIGDLFEATSSVPQFVEVVKKDVTKAQALQKISELLNIPSEDMIVFGDEDNDLPMMKYAGYSVAMGNASENVKKHSDFITKTNDEEGVAFALNKIFEDN